MKCKKCGMENNESAKFCRNCGEPLEQEEDIILEEEEKVCPFCGSELDKNAKFCKNCGQSITSKDDIPIKRKRKIGWVCLGSILGVILLIWIFIAIDYIVDGELIISSLGKQDNKISEQNIKDEDNMEHRTGNIQIEESNEEKEEKETSSEENKKEKNNGKKDTESEKSTKINNSLDTEENESNKGSNKESKEEINETTTIQTTTYGTTEATIENYPVSNTVVSENGHKYELYDVSLSWKEAKKYCESKNGHLVTITSQEEQNIVQSLLVSGTKKYYWIGATDEIEEGQWQWVTGEIFAYTNWCQDPLQPDNHSGIGGVEEDYGELLQIDGKWMDLQETGDPEGESQSAYAGFIFEYES